MSLVSQMDGRILLLVNKFVVCSSHDIYARLYCQDSLRIDWSRRYGDAMSDGS